MDAMDEMFVPYKEMFEPPAPKPLIVTRAPTFNWLWLVPIVFIIALIAAYAYRQSIKEPLSLGTSINLPLASVPPQIIVTTEKTAPVKPQEFSSPQELAKGVGAQLRDVLLTHKQVPALSVAGIVSHAVRTLLGEDERAVEQPQAAAQSAQPVAHPVAQPVAQAVAQPILKKEALVLDDLDPEPEPPKRGKINADTDPGLLKLLKERGLNA
jgi:hypothetical protein